MAFSNNHERKTKTKQRVGSSLHDLGVLVFLFRKLKPKQKMSDTHPAPMSRPAFFQRMFYENTQM